MAVVLLFMLIPSAIGPALKAAGDTQTLTVLTPNDTQTLDPAVNYDFTGAPYLGVVYENLVRAQGVSDAKIVPGLAESWEKSDDGLT
jgi:ABC-type transport system substrate-binding protein